MVVGTGLVSRFPPVVLRSTSTLPYGGIWHPAHDAACGTADCDIDQPGWIRDQVVREIPLREFTGTRRSCREPDEDLVEKLMQPTSHRRRRRVRGSGR